jgi:hypothetical protein
MRTCSEIAHDIAQLARIIAPRRVRRSVAVEVSAERSGRAIITSQVISGKWVQVQRRRAFAIHIGWGESQENVRGRRHRANWPSLRARRELIVGGKPRARWAWDDAVRAPPDEGVGTPRSGEDDFEAAPDDRPSAVERRRQAPLHRRNVDRRGGGEVLAFQNIERQAHVLRAPAPGGVVKDPPAEPDLGEDDFEGVE